MKAGFTLIELIMALGFSAIICTVLMSSLFQIMNSNQIADKNIENDMRIMLLNTYFERDITSAFIPFQAIEKPLDEKKQKKIENAFYASNKAENIRFLTCITNNLLLLYQMGKSKVPKTGTMRVVYRLIEDPEHKNAFILFRQESSNLYLAQDFKDKSDKGYELIKGIKTMNAIYKTQVKDQNKKEEKEIEYKDYKEWTEEQIKNDLLLPEIMSLRVTLWTTDYLGEKNYELNYVTCGFERQDKGIDLASSTTPKSMPNLPAKPRTQLNKGM